MRYLGPMFYGNWSPNRDLNDDGTCGNADVNYATQFKDRNVRYWYLGTNFYPTGQLMYRSKTIFTFNNPHFQTHFAHILDFEPKIFQDAQVRLNPYY